MVANDLKMEKYIGNDFDGSYSNNPDNININNNNNNNNNSNNEAYHNESSDNNIHQDDDKHWQTVIDPDSGLVIL